MTEEGYAALKLVIEDGRVAIRLGEIITLLYLFQGYWLENERWVPIALSPVATANLQGAKLVFSIPDDVADYVLDVAPGLSHEVFRRI